MENMESLHTEKKKTFRLAHVLFGKRMTLPGNSIVMQFLYGVGGIL